MVPWILSQYQILEKEIEQLEAQIDRLEAIARSPRVADLSGMPRSGRVTDGMGIVAKIDELKTKYYNKLGRLVELQEAAENMLSTLEGEERLVIRYKYIDGLKNRDIADKLSYSDSTIKRRIWAAHETLNRIENGENNDG